MKELAVKNYRTAEGQKISQDGNEFTVKPIVAQADVNQCRVNFVEVEPGSFAYGYHYHETDEEVFYIISGTGIVRTINGDVTVKAGDAITFPGSDTEKLVYIDFDTNNLPEIVHFPDTNQVMAYGKFSNGIYDKK